MRGVQGG